MEIPLSSTGAAQCQAGGMTQRLDLPASRACSRSWSRGS